MSEFDWFGEYEKKADAPSSGGLDISFEFDYENVLNDGIDKIVKLCATIRPNNDLRRDFDQNGIAQHTHLCLVMDTSESMHRFNREDNPNAVKTGKYRMGEDGKKITLYSGATTKLDIAVDSAKNIIDLMRKGDTLSCITYDDDARIEFENMQLSNREEIIANIENIRKKMGNNTNISKALILADEVLAKYDDNMPKRVIFFTDGEPTGEDNELKGIEAGQLLADHNIPLECMGFGKDSVNLPYLEKMSSFSGGSTKLIRYPDEFANYLSSMFTQAQSIIATNARLTLKLTTGIKILHYYRGVPDNVYLGSKEDSEDRILDIYLGQIENNQEYKYYFNVKLPGVDSDFEDRLNTMSAELRYVIPGDNESEEQITKENVLINYTSDKEEASEINGNVNVMFRLAEVKRFDEEREKAYKAGNKEETIKWLKKIIDTYTELQQPVQAKDYSNMLEEYMKTNKISKGVLNTATSSSTQAIETGILEDLENEEISRLSQRLRNRRRL